MPDGFDVDVEVQRRAVPHFADAGAELTSALEDLQSVLARCAGMCGDDEHGRQFASEYQPRADLLAKGLTAGAGAVQGVGRKVAMAADNYLDLDTFNAERTRSAGGPVT